MRYCAPGLVLLAAAFAEAGAANPLAPEELVLQIPSPGTGGARCAMRSDAWSKTMDAVTLNRKRTVARLHEKTANRRKDHLHKASHGLVEGHAGVAGEKFSAKALMRTRMAGSMGDAGLGEFRRQLAYKAGWAGRLYHEHPTFQRSTGVCPCCDLVGEKLALSIREWTCKGCGAVHDRDTAAARVILRGAMEVWGAQASETDTVGRAPPEPPGAYRGKRAFAMPRGPGDPSPGSAHGSAANVVNPDGVKSPEGDGALFGG